MTDSLRIVELRASNFKRLEAVAIKPDGNVVTITGRNGQGKTSVLDAIMVALGGGTMAPERPVRTGADKAEIEIDLGEYKVRRVLKPDGTSTVTVAAANGARFPGPQAMLDSLFGDLSFDPLAFLRMKPSEQVATLKRLAGLDFSELDGQRIRAYEERTLVNRELKQMQARLDAMPDVAAPDQEVSVGDLLEQRKRLEAEKGQQDVLRKNHDRAMETLNGADVAVSQQRQYIEELEATLAKARADLGTLIQDRNEACSKLKALETAIAALPAIDFAAIDQQIRDAGSINAQVRARRDRQALAQHVASIKAKAEALTRQIDAIDLQKQQNLAAVKMPVEGLSIEEGVVTFRGIPISQISAAEQSRVSVAMGAALNPKLRVILIRDASLYDADSLRLLHEFAESNDLQIWIERVLQGEPVGIVIEDGRIASATPTPEPAIA